MKIISLVAFFASVITFSSCTPSQRSTMTGAFATCANADLGALVAPGETLLSDVGQIILGNAPTLETDLGSLAATLGTLGIDAVLCAITAVEAVLAPTPVATPASNAAPPPPVPPGLVRARAWAAQQQAKIGNAK